MMRNWIAVLLTGLAVTGCVGESPESPPASAVGSDAPSAKEESPDERHWRLAQEELAEGDPPGALEHLQSINRDGSAISIQAALTAAQIQQSQGRVNETLPSLEYFLQHEPGHNAVRERAAQLYALTGQRAEADLHLSRLLMTPDFDFKPLVLLTDFERRHGEDYTLLQNLELQAPGDPAVQLGLAVENIKRGDVASARRRLESAIAADSELATAQALLGELLLESSDEELVRWYRGLPESVQNHSAIWYVRGLWAQQLGEPMVAARCFWESIRQCPTAYRSIYQLGQVYGDFDPQIRQSFSKRAEEIHELTGNLSRVLDSGGRDEEAAQTLVKQLLDSGREWEAWSWAVLMSSKFPGSPWLKQTLSKLSAYPHTTEPRILDSANLALQFDLSRYPDFSSIESRLGALTEQRSDEAEPGRIRFEDVAQSLGIDFTYHRGRVAGLDGIRMQESTGGGVGVLDYDNDGWPDLFLTQGEDWPIGADQPSGRSEYRDKLFRNLSTRFEDQTDASAMPEEDGYGQGCACGDFNNDGFADIYVANIGSNQLLINNGDGTFTDATPDVATSLNDWTSSCAMADLNLDGNPDVFDVNYVEGEQLYQMTCNDSDCSPEVYDEAPDHAFLSLGDGQLRLVEPEMHGRAGAGLGVVAFRADRESPTSSTVSIDETIDPVPLAVGSFDTLAPERYLSVFVGNDQDPNAFLKVSTPEGSQDFALTDESFLAGLALNQDGKTTACMGIASGDITGDGRLDLFVTNYKDEPNSLYLQESAGLFSDSIRGSGLMRAGLPYVGWGTQCLDADNDGDLDLMVTNGHVGEFDKEGLQERMPSQFFRNQGVGQFREVPPNELGSFFDRQLMGRSLAVLDWNRDGRTDAALSLLDENAVLLTNQSTDVGNWVALRLVGTVSSRDAIGTVVTLYTADAAHRRQLTAGDGYQATNERLLSFGLGGVDTIDRMVVEWPSGQTQEFVDVPANRRLLVTEGAAYLLSP